MLLSTKRPEWQHKTSSVHFPPGRTCICVATYTIIISPERQFLPYDKLKWPECWPHVAHAVNMLKYQTHLISPFWKTKMRQKKQSWKELHTQNEASPSDQTHFLMGSNSLCVAYLCVNLQDFGAWEPWSQVVLAASPFDKQSQRHVAFGTFHIQKCYCFKHAYFKIYNFLI